MSTLTLDQLEEVEQMSTHLAELDARHADAIASWRILPTCPSGGHRSGEGYRLFCDIYSFGTRRLKIERDIGALLDGFITNQQETTDP